MTVSRFSKASLSVPTKYRTLMAGSEAIIPGDFELISTTVLSSSAASVTFSGLGTSAADYKHLQIRAVARTDSGSAYEQIMVRANGVTSAAYSRHRLVATGSAVSSSEGYASQTQMELGSIVGGTGTANAFGAVIIDILDFASTSKNKTFRSLSGSNVTGQNVSSFESGAWFNTAAITSISLDRIFGSNFVTGSRFSLYGMRG